MTDKPCHPVDAIDPHDATTLVGLLAATLGTIPVTGWEHLALEHVLQDLSRYDEESANWPATEPLDALYLALLDAYRAACAFVLTGDRACMEIRRADQTASWHPSHG